MKHNDICKIKTFSNLLDDSKGFIGKSVPCTPTFLGCFLLRQYYSSSIKTSQNRLILVNEVQKLRKPFMKRSLNHDIP